VTVLEGSEGERDEEDRDKDRERARPRGEAAGDSFLLFSFLFLSFLRLSFFLSLSVIDYSPLFSQSATTGRESGKRMENKRDRHERDLGLI